jgi:hypothetical protein
MKTKLNVVHMERCWSFSFPLVFWLAYIVLDDVAVGIVLNITKEIKLFFLIGES